MAATLSQWLISYLGAGSHKTILQRLLILQLLKHLNVLWTHSHYYIPVWGDFWQFDPKVGYFQNIRSAMMASSKSPYNKGSVPLSPHTQDSSLPYWVQYNTDFKRQKEIKYFSMVRVSVKM